MTDPRPLDMETTGERLAAQALAAAERLGTPAPLHRATEEALEPDDYDAEVLAIARSAGLAEVRQQIWQRCIPSRFHWASLDDFTGQVHDELTGWASDPGDRNLLLLGPVGVGKSHAAVAAARVRFDRGVEVRFLPVVELLDLLRPGGPENALYELADLELLVLDDLGSERPTDWTAERLYALVNRRWLEGRPTIATSNLSAVCSDGQTVSDLEAALGPRVFSRLVGCGSVAIGLSGPDRRRRGPR